ncbi:MAG: 5-formyltetrahydrofolate cyclo-ligase [Actinomycetota bacterium]
MSGEGVDRDAGEGVAGSATGRVAAQKRELRRTMRAVRDQLDDRNRRSAAVADRLTRLVAAHRARRVVAYRAVGSEVDPIRAVRWFEARDVEVVLPDAVPGAEQPVAGDWPDLVALPGLAFTAAGDRLGQGGGWFDRFVADRRADCLLVGLGFLPQILDSLPVAAHDVQLDCVVTEDRTWWAP